MSVLVDIDLLRGGREGGREREGERERGSNEVNRVHTSFS